MMKKRRMWFILLLTVLMLAPSAGVSAASQKVVAKIGNRSYTSMESALSAVKKGQTIRLMANVDVALGDFITELELGKNARYTIDLNRKTLGTAYNLPVRAGNVTIKNGTLKCQKILVTNQAKVTFSNVTFKERVENISGKKYTYAADIESEEGASLTFKKCKMSKDGDIRSKGTLTISGGTYGHVWNEGSKKMTINAGMFKSQIVQNGPGSTVIKKATVDADKRAYNDDAYGICLEAGTMKIQNCIYKGKTCGIYIQKDAKLTINGGTYSLTGYHYDGGRWVYGTMFSNFGSVTINGGTFKRGGREDADGLESGITSGPGSSLKSGPKVKWINCN